MKPTNCLGKKKNKQASSLKSTDQKMGSHVATSYRKP